MFYADEDEWMSLGEAERSEAIGRIGRWFGELAAAGHDRRGHPAGRRQAGDDDRSARAVIEAQDREAAIAIAKTWPAGGLVEVRAVAE